MCIEHDSLTPPFTQSLLDRLVTLTTPPRGLSRAMSELSPLLRICLEDALLGSERVIPDNPPAVSSAAPSFFWHLPAHEADQLFRQHGGLRRIPFLLLQCGQPGFPNLDTGSTVVTLIDRLSRTFYGERHARAGNPRIFRLETKPGKPVMAFMDQATRWQAGASRPIPMHWVAELGLKFTLILIRLQDAAEPNSILIKAGLELAKFYARQHMENLSAYVGSAAAENAELAELDEREMQVFLKICDQEPLTKAELRRSFHHMLAEERDRIIAKLLTSGLITMTGGKLQHNTAGCSGAEQLARQQRNRPAPCAASSGAAPEAC